MYEGLSLPVLASASMILAATFIRWRLIPRVEAPTKILVLIIIGLALSEAEEFLGLFLVPPTQPETKLTLWILSGLSIAQFAPVYTLRFRKKNPFREGEAGFIR